MVLNLGYQQSLNQLSTKKKKLTCCPGNPDDREAVSGEERSDKLEYKDKTEAQYSRGDLRAAWHGIKNMASINQHAPRPGKPLV